LTKYTFDYVGVGLETSRRKSLKRLGQERGVSRMSARRATELLKLRLQNSRLDSATFHTTHASFETVREFFGDRVISRGLWPLRFRDITPSDLFVGKFKRQSF